MNPLRGAVPVSFKTLGCKVNQVESEDIAADLIGRGARIVAEDEAVLVIVNTCTVTGEADAKARKAVRHALNAAASPVVIVTGCLAALDAAGLEDLGDRVIAEPDKELVPARVAQALEQSGHVLAGDGQVPARTGAGFHSRAQLKIEDGCDAFCAYCVVPLARGGPRSTPMDAIVSEAERLRAAGVREIVLTGINVGRYRDTMGGTGEAVLADVIERVSATGVERVRLSSVEPLDLDARLLDAIANTPAFCEHLHVPLQSGDDDVLRAMGRGYDVATFTERVEAVRAALPGVAITTDVLAGFPGESDEHAARTLAFCERIGFARLHVFRYSARRGTRAAEMPDQVDPAVRAERAGALRELDRRLRQRHADARLGDIAEILVEREIPVEREIGGTSVRTVEGTTRDYLRVRAMSPGANTGDLLEVHLERYRDGTIEGTAGNR